MKDNCKPIKSCGQTVIPQTDESQLDCDIIVPSDCVNVSKDYLTLQILKDDKLTDLLDKLVNAAVKTRTQLLELIPTTEPTNPSAGNLYYDSSSNIIRYYNGTQWVDISISGTGTDNQTLSINGLDLTITGGNTITLPSETTTTLVDNGTSFSYTNEEGVVTTVTLPTGGTGSGINNLVEDTTPQLGGDLDLNGNDIPVSPTQQTALNSKQETLVSGTNLKTINGESLLGSTDIVISGGGSTITAGNGITNDSGTFNAGGTLNNLIRYTLDGNDFIIENNNTSGSRFSIGEEDIDMSGFRNLSITSDGNGGGLQLNTSNVSGSVSIGNSIFNTDIRADNLSLEGSLITIELSNADIDNSTNPFTAVTKSWVQANSGGSSLPTGNLNDTLFHNGTDFVKATPVIEKPTGLTGNTITLANTPLTTNEFYFDLLINIPRVEGASNDYTISGNTITTNFTLQATDVIRVKYLIA